MDLYPVKAIIQPTRLRWIKAELSVGFYSFMYSDLDQQEGLLSTNCVDTIITMKFICDYVDSTLFTNG